MSRRGYYWGKMDELRAEFGGRCVDGPAGCRGPLEFAHVKPTGMCGRGRGLIGRYHDIKRNRDCYALRCRRHHRRYDDAHWERLLAQSKGGECQTSPGSAG